MTSMHTSPADSPPQAAAAIRILVVDDHPASRLVLRAQLKHLGWPADFAANGLLALEKFAHRTYQLVLTDLSMPVLDGFGLAARLRAQGFSVPVIAMSASTDEQTQRRCAGVGIDRLLPKPCPPAELDAAIRTHLPRAEAETVEQPAPFPSAFYTAMRKTSNESLARIGAALESNQQDVALAELHSMKGGFMVAQMRDAANACETLQKQLLAGEHSAALAAFAALRLATVTALDATG